MKASGWREYFTFSKRERRAILVLVLVLLLLCGGSYWFHRPVISERNAGVIQVRETPDSEFVSNKKASKAVDAADEGGPDSAWHSSGDAPGTGGHYPRNDMASLSRGSPPADRETYPVRRDASGRSYSAARKTNYYRQPLEINAADTTAWIALPGIGSKLARRIVAYRSSLRGFDSVGQLRKVYGLRHSVFESLRPWLRCTPRG